MPVANLLSKRSPSERPWTEAERRLLEVLRDPEYRQMSLVEICRLAGCSPKTWQLAIKRVPFFQAVQQLGFELKRPAPRGSHRASAFPQHTEVRLATNPEEEMAKDVWDLRTLKADYPKHRYPSDFILDFSFISNLLLRQQIKQYFRQKLPRWEAATAKSRLQYFKPLLSRLPPEVHLGTLERKHIEDALPYLWQTGETMGYLCLVHMKGMLQYMATSPAWPGVQPARFLIWPEDLPDVDATLPRPVPPNVLDQLDALLEQAAAAMKAGQTPPFTSPMLWDAILILRRTGMRSGDVAHLKAPNSRGRNGCLEQDAEGYWWIRIDHKRTKMRRDHRIPTKLSDGVIDAIRRQSERIKGVPDHFDGHYLFRNEQEVLTYTAITGALDRLAPHLLDDGRPYTITPHQFRHSIATDMIEQGIDIHTVKEFLGHTSLAMTEKYVKIYLKTLKARYDFYRARKEETYAATMLANEVEVKHNAGERDGGWVEGSVGTLYRSPLPNGIGNCAHLAMLDPCPTPPVCETCPKLQASRRHLPVWENKVQSLLITVEALRENPIYARARQKHEQELQHAEKVVKTIRKEGYWDGRIHNTQSQD